MHYLGLKTLAICLYVSTLQYKKVYCQDGHCSPEREPEHLVGEKDAKGQRRKMLACHFNVIS